MNWSLAIDYQRKNGGYVNRGMVGYIVDWYCLANNVQVLSVLIKIFEIRRVKLCPNQYKMKD
jgi:hypothetical protein